MCRKFSASPAIAEVELDSEESHDKDGVSALTAVVAAVTSAPQDGSNVDDELFTPQYVRDLYKRGSWRTILAPGFTERLLGMKTAHVNKQNDLRTRIQAIVNVDDYESNEQLLASLKACQEELDALERQDSTAQNDDEYGAAISDVHDEAAKELMGYIYNCNTRYALRRHPRLITSSFKVLTLFASLCCACGLLAYQEEIECGDESDA